MNIIYLIISQSAKITMFNSFEEPAPLNEKALFLFESSRFFSYCPPKAQQSAGFLGVFLKYGNIG